MDLEEDKNGGGETIWTVMTTIWAQRKEGLNSVMAVVAKKRGTVV